MELTDPDLQTELAKVKNLRFYFHDRRGVPAATLPQEKVALAALQAAAGDRRSKAARDRAFSALEQLTDAYMQ